MKKICPATKAPTAKFKGMLDLVTIEHAKKARAILIGVVTIRDVVKLTFHEHCGASFRKSSGMTESGTKSENTEHGRTADSEQQRGCYGHFYLVVCRLE